MKGRHIMYVVTLKPKSIDRQLFEEIQSRGIDHFRVNLARNSLEENLDLIRTLKQNSTTIFVDLPGEKLRINYNSDVKMIKEGELFTLKHNVKKIYNSNCATISNTDFFKMVSCGDILTIGDANAQFIVKNIINNEIEISCIATGKIYNKAGLIINGKYIEKKHLCRTDLDIIKQLNYSLIDYVCVSFADHSDIIREVRRHIPSDANTKVIAKIESPVGVNNLLDIMTESDGILLARSDLSKFYTIEQLSQLAEYFKLNILKGKTLIFASNYLLKSIQSGTLIKKELNYLIHDFNLNPDYIYINESYYNNVMDVIEYYIKATTEERI